MKEWSIRTAVNGGWIVSSGRNHEGRIGYGAIPEEYAFTSTADLLDALPTLLKAESGAQQPASYDASAADDRIGGVVITHTNGTANKASIPDA